MSDSTNHGFNTGHLLLALVTGAVAGAGVAYLTAPYSGAGTRTRLHTIAHDTNAAAHRVPDAVRKATQAAQEAFIAALDLGEDEEPEVTVSKRKRAKA